MTLTDTRGHLSDPGHGRLSSARTGEAQSKPGMTKDQREKLGRLPEVPALPGSGTVLVEDGLHKLKVYIRNSKETTIYF